MVALYGRATVCGSSALTVLTPDLFYFFNLLFRLLEKKTHAKFIQKYYAEKNYDSFDRF